jgi:hypothetical protein
MSEITAISTALQVNQSRLHNEISMLVIKQAAQAEKALADMLAQNIQATQGSKSGNGGFSIYV